MKTTLVIDDSVMERLKAAAARQRRTMSELVEVALRRFLDEREPLEQLHELPSFDGGGALVDVADRDALYNIMDGR
jgi:hypothetical protein